MSLSRRTFLTAAGASGLLAALPSSLRAEKPTAGKAWLELRKYGFASVAKREAFEAYLALAAVPALNRAGIKPVGAFTLNAADNPKLAPPPAGTDLYVLLPHPNAESLALLARTLDRDAVYRAAGRTVIEAPRTDPAFTSLESSVLIAHDQVPQVEVPSQAATRVLQLRIYRGHNDDRSLRKNEMFDVGGEIEIFRRTGLNPVFFGRGLAGGSLPNVTYMLGFESPETQAANWKKFVSDPAWTKLKNDPAYADTEPTITNLILRPSPASQI